jgi:hypothetical protein
MKDREHGVYFYRDYPKLARGRRKQTLRQQGIHRTLEGADVVGRAVEVGASNYSGSSTPRKVYTEIDNSEVDGFNFTVFPR